MNYIMSDHNRNFMGKSPHRKPQDPDEALGLELKMRENSLRAVFISAGAISASVVYRLVYNLRNVQTLLPPFLLSAIHSQLSGTPFSMPSPHAPLPSMSSNSPFQFPSFDMSESTPRILRMNVYWFTCLVFSSSAFFLAMFGKQIIRERRVRLAAFRQGARIQGITSGYLHRFDVSNAMDSSIFRLLQVALILLLLANVDTIVISVDINIFAAIVIFGLFYVFGFIGLAPRF